MSKRRLAWRKAAIVTATAVLLGGGIAGTTRAGNDIVGEWNFFVNCFDLMINNTPQQVRQCDPKVRNIVTNNPSLSEKAPSVPLLPASSSSTTTSTTTSTSGT